MYQHLAERVFWRTQLILDSQFRVRLNFVTARVVWPCVRLQEMDFSLSDLPVAPVSWGCRPPLPFQAPFPRTLSCFWCLLSCPFHFLPACTLPLNSSPLCLFVMRAPEYQTLKQLHDWTCFVKGHNFQIPYTDYQAVGTTASLSPQHWPPSWNWSSSKTAFPRQQSTKLCSSLS